MQIFADRCASARSRVRFFTVGACVLGALAFTTSAQAAVNGSHVIATLYTTSALELSGYTPDTALDMTVTRNGVLIGHATGTSDATGALTVNPASCWIDTTPVILAGDVVAVTGDGPEDSMVVQGVTAGRPAKGTAANTIVVHGTAADAAGNQLLAGATESRLITAGKFANGKKSLRATAVYDSATSTNWTATYTAVTGGDVSTALAAASRGVYAPLVSEVTISVNPGAPGPSAPCTAPLAANGVTSADHVYKGAPTVNVSNSASDLVLSGVAQTDASAVSVKVTDAGTGATAAVAGTLTTGAGAKTWTATIPAGEVAALGDGKLTATGTFTTPGGTIGGGTLSILKDTVAPAAPVASPAGGNYTAAQSVSLFDTDAGAAMFYTTDGTTPNVIADPATRQYATPIAVSSSLALKALAVDTAGNVSVISTNTYTLGGALTLSPGTIDFGSQSFNTPSAGVPVTLKNNGAASVTISSVAITGVNSADFLRGISTCTGATLAPTESCTVDNVRFQPQGNGARTAALTFTDDTAAGTHSVSLTGSGFGFIPPPTGPVAVVTPGSLSYANQVVGTTSAAQTVTVKNTGDAALVVGTTPVTGTDFVKGTDTCAGTSVPVQASCTIDVQFAPGTTGAKTGTLTINDNAAGNPHTVGLTGTGSTATAPAATVTPATVAFGSQNTGGSSTAQTVTVKNTGDAALVVGTTPVTGTDFVKGTDTCAGTTVAPLASCTIDLTFAPATAGAKTGTLTINDNAVGAPHTSSLTGTGVTPTAPAVTLTPASLAFGSQLAGAATAAQTVTVKNSGDAALVIGTTPITGTDFVKGTDTCAGTSVAPLASCTIAVSFAPATAGAKTGTLTINDNAVGAPHTVALTGTGTAPTAPVATLTPASRTYAAQLVGTTSVAQTATMTNTGDAPMTLSVALAGTNVGDYVIASNTCGTTLAVAAACTVGVTFKPTAAGTRTAALRFSDNSGNVIGATQNVTLSGTGTAPAITVSPTAINSGTSKIGFLGIGKTSTTVNVTVSNSGSAPLTITTSTIGAAASSSAPGDYSISATTCTNKTLAVGSTTCSLTVKFSATAKGTRNATLTINSNAPTGPKTVAITGTGA